MSTPATDLSTAPPVPSSRRRWLPWLGLLLPLAALGALLAVEATRPPDLPATIGTLAPDFELADTAGATESLDEALADGSNGAVLYFSMGVGCGGCFAQIPEIADVLDDLGVRLVSIMVDEAGITRVEAGRYGATTPIALDRDRSVSNAFGMLDSYGHGDRPSHSFVYVGPDRTIRQVRHYAEMFVPAPRLLTDLAIP